MMIFPFALMIDGDTLFWRGKRLLIRYSDIIRDCCQPSWRAAPMTDILLRVALKATVVLPALLTSLSQPGASLKEAMSILCSVFYDHSTKPYLVLLIHLMTKWPIIHSNVVRPKFRLFRPWFDDIPFPFVTFWPKDSPTEGPIRNSVFFDVLLRRLKMVLLVLPSIIDIVGETRCDTLKAILKWYSGGRPVTDDWLTWRRRPTWQQYVSIQWKGSVGQYCGILGTRWLLIHHCHWYIPWFEVLTAIWLHSAIVTDCCDLTIYWPFIQADDSGGRRNPLAPLLKIRRWKNGRAYCVTIPGIHCCQ